MLDLESTQVASSVINEITAFDTTEDLQLGYRKFDDRNEEAVCSMEEIKKVLFALFLQTLLWQDEIVGTWLPLHQAKPWTYGSAIFESTYTRLALCYCNYLAGLRREISSQFSPKGAKLKLTELLSSKDKKFWKQTIYKIYIYNCYGRKRLK